MLDTLFYYGIISLIIINILVLFLFAYTLQLLVKNQKKDLKYKKALLYSLIFILFFDVGLFISSYLILFIGYISFLSQYIGGAVLGGLAIYIFGKNILKDDFTNLGLLIKTILATSLLYIIFMGLLFTISTFFINLSSLN